MRARKSSVLHIWPRKFIQDDNLFYTGLLKLIITIGFHNPRGKSRSMNKGKRFTMKNKKTEGREKYKHKHHNKRFSLPNSYKKERRFTHPRAQCRNGTGHLTLNYSCHFISASQWNCAPTWRMHSYPITMLPYDTLPDVLQQPYRTERHDRLE